MGSWPWLLASTEIFGGGFLRMIDLDRTASPIGVRIYFGSKPVGSQPVEPV